MLISSFLPSTGGQGSEQRHFNSQAEGQSPFKQSIMYNKSPEKQVKETVSNLESELASSLQYHQMLLEKFNKIK